MHPLTLNCLETIFNLVPHSNEEIGFLIILLHIFTNLNYLFWDIFIQINNIAHVFTILTLKRVVYTMVSFIAFIVQVHKDLLPYLP
jgi:hypothetical protein